MCMGASETVKLLAHDRPFCVGPGRPVQPGEIFSVDPATAESLEARGLASRHFEPKTFAGCEPVRPLAAPRVRPSA